MSGPGRGPRLEPGADGSTVVLEPARGVGEALRARRVQLGWSQARAARASGVSRTVVNEIERGRRTPSLRTYTRLRAALGLDALPAQSLLPTAEPAEPEERLLSSLAAALLTVRGAPLAELATALQVDIPTVRAGLRAIGGRLAAVGLAAVDDGVTAGLAVLPHAAGPVARLTPLEPAHTLSEEALTALIIVGHLGEATRRQVEERRGADSSGLLDRLTGWGLLTRRTDPDGPGRPQAYRLTGRALTLLGHATAESFQAWCAKQVDPATPAPG